MGILCRVEGTADFVRCWYGMDLFLLFSYLES